MFGIKMFVKTDKVSVLLRPMSKDDLPELVEHFSSMKVHMYTLGLFGQTYENELEWYEKNRKDKDSCVWIVQPENSDKPIGVTSLHDINSLGGGCTSGFITWKSEWWNKGVATASHLGRTMFAADYLNRSMIKSIAREDNKGSWMALERVGYTVWGTEPLDGFRQGKWLNSYHLLWLHPERISLFYSNGLPDIFKDGVEKAKEALEKARKCVEMI